MNVRSFRMWIAAAALAALGAAGAPAEEGGAKRIAVVNVSRVFKAYKKVDAIQKKLETLFAERKKAIEQEEKDLANEMRAFQMTNPDPERNRDHLAKFQQLQIAKFDVDKKKFDFAKEVEEKRLEEMKQVLKEIREAIRSVGAAEQIDMIMRAPEYDIDGTPEAEGEEEDPMNTEPKNSAELVRRFRENPVLYFSTGVDVTQKVINHLNTAYEKAGP